MRNPPGIAKCGDRRVSYQVVHVRRWNKFNRNLGFSAVRMWYDIGTERLMYVSSLIDKI